MYNNYTAQCRNKRIAPDDEQRSRYRAKRAIRHSRFRQRHKRVHHQNRQYQHPEQKDQIKPKRNLIRQA